MATTNPMQRKAKNSFLLGVLLTMLVMGVIVGLLFLKIMNMQKAENERLANQKQVYVLSQDVKSGDKVDSANLKTITVDNAAVPSNAITPGSLTEYTVAKIDLKKGTTITAGMITESSEETTADLRMQEYNMIKLSTQLATNDYIDIRLRMPSGLDYIVVSKKSVEIPVIGGEESSNTIWVKLSEAETLAMSNAIVEAYTMNGAILYTTTYTEPGMQDAATPTYVPSANVQNLMNQNPNILQEAKNALFTRYNSTSSIRTNNINGELSQYQEEAQGNISNGVSSEVTSAQEQRKSYLDALAGK
ncbi:MAG: hypothetical protein ACLTXD_01270 [Clostridia bacterium]